MTRRATKSTVACALATLIVFAGVKIASAAGYWNVPSNICQWCGHGFGGGYHAPLMLGPPTCDCFVRPNEVRLPCAPNPYACAPYCNGAYGGQASMMTPNAQPNLMPQHMAPQNTVPSATPEEDSPASAPREALFAPPVQ